MKSATSNYTTFKSEQVEIDLNGNFADYLDNNPGKMNAVIVHLLPKYKIGSRIVLILKNV